MKFRKGITNVQIVKINPGVYTLGVHVEPGYLGKIKDWDKYLQKKADEFFYELLGYRPKTLKEFQESIKK